MKKALPRTSKAQEAKAERALMLAFYQATGLGALQHWHLYSQWKQKRFYDQQWLAMSKATGRRVVAAQKVRETRATTTRARATKKKATIAVQNARRRARRQ